MLTAITRAVSPALAHCELSFISRQRIDLEKARLQHRAYEQLLEKLGARVISLPAEPDLPDSMFVEDPAIVLDELAVILPLGTETRRREAGSLAQALSRSIGRRAMKESSQLARAGLTARVMAVSMGKEEVYTRWRKNEGAVEAAGEG